MQKAQEAATNRQLRTLVKRHGLTHERIAELTASSRRSGGGSSTVEKWLVSPATKSHRVMPEAKLALLRYRLKDAAK